jgi:hypothetical protein
VHQGRRLRAARRHPGVVPQSRLAGTVEAVDDPVAPALDADAFEALAKATRARS